MDESSRATLDGYLSSLNIYKEKVGEDNEKLKAAFAFLREMEKVAEQAGDFMQFHETASDKDMYNKMTALLTECALEKPKGNFIPTVEQAAYGYHAAYNSLPDDIKNGSTGNIYRKIFEIEKKSDSAIQFNRLMAEAHIFADLSRVHLKQVLMKGLEDLRNAGKESGSGGVSSPAVENYFENAIKDMESAQSVTEIEYLAHGRSEVVQLAVLWDTGFCNAVFFHFGSALGSYMMAETDENRQAVINGMRFINEYFGLDWDSLFAVERVSHYFREVIWRSVEKDQRAKGITSAEMYLGTLREYYDKAMRDQPPVIPNRDLQKTLLWGRELPLSQVHAVLKNLPDLY